MRAAAAGQLTEARWLGDDGFARSWDPPNRRLKRSVFFLQSPAMQVERVRRAIGTPGQEWGDTETLRHLLLHAPAFRDRNLGFAILSIRRAPIKRLVPTAANNAGPIKGGMGRSREVTVGWGPRASTHILRLDTTQSLLCLYNVADYDQPQNTWHWMLVGVASTPSQPSQPSPTSSTGTTISSSFPIESYPPALFPFLRETQALEPTPSTTPTTTTTNTNTTPAPTSLR
jgi:hypothetical protein